MYKNDFKSRYDGICIYATTKVKANTISKFILLFINFVLLGIIIMFSVEREFLAALVFFGFELFIIKYTLWNLFGEERLIINARSLSYQQHYGFFTTSFHTINFNKKIIMLPYEEVIEENKIYVKFLFESYNENNLPDVIYYSVLNVRQADFEELTQQIDRLFMDEMVTSYEMPIIRMN